MSDLLERQSPDAVRDPDARAVICDLCREFYRLGWATGTGGGISVRVGQSIYMAPSGVQKERLQPDEIFVLDMNGDVQSAPATGNLRVSACRPLFMHAYQLRDAGAVLHSHSQNAVLATLLFDDTFRISGIEMIKGIHGSGVFDTLEVPIIDNTAQESDLSDALRKAIVSHPRSHAVLVRGHGVYVWGRDWVHAKTQAECYDYLFSTAIRMKELGIDAGDPLRRHDRAGRLETAAKGSVK